jgi:hypothetical protein
MVPVVPGQRIRFQGYKKCLEVPTGGTAHFYIAYITANGSGTLQTEIDLDLSGVDGSYVLVDHIFDVPATAVHLSGVSIVLFGLTYAGGGVKLRFDDIQCWLETSALDSDLFEQRKGPNQVTDLTIYDPDMTDFGGTSKASILKFDHTANTLSVINRNPANPGPIVAINDLTASDITATGTSTLGGALLGSIADADVPRIDMVSSTFAGVEYTLIEQVIPGGGGTIGYRRYQDTFGRYLETVNAKWDNTTNLWSKDLTNNEASQKDQDGYNLVLKVRKFDEDAPWGPGGWTFTGLNVVRNGLVLPETTEVIPLHEGQIGYENGLSYYQNTGVGGSDWASSANGAKFVEFTVLKDPGRRLVALSVYGTSGSVGGEELEAKLWERPQVGGPTQKGGTKTSGLANGVDTISWTDADPDLKYTLPSARNLTLSVRLPNVAGGVVSIFGIEYTWDQPQP